MNVAELLFAVMSAYYIYLIHNLQGLLSLTYFHFYLLYFF